MLKSAYVVRVYPDPVFYKGVEFVRHEAAVFGRFPSRRKAISVFRAIRRELGLNKERKFRNFYAAIDDILATKDLPRSPWRALRREERGPGLLLLRGRTHRGRENARMVVVRKKGIPIHILEEPRGQTHQDACG